MTNPVDGGSNGNWKEVQSGYQRGDSLKKEATVTVSRNGVVEALVDATQMLAACGRARNLARGKFLLKLIVDEATGQVAAVPIPIKEGTASSAQVRWWRGKGSYRSSFHIGGVFKDYPDLAPVGTVECKVDIATAPDGLPMLVIPIKAGVSTQTSSTPGAQSAAGENN